MRIIAKDSIQAVALKSAMNQCAMRRDEAYVVYDFVDMREVESHSTAAQAKKACNILNQDRTLRYAWDYLPEHDGGLS